MVLASLCLPAIAITAVLTSGHHSGAPAPVRHSGGQKPTAALSDRSSAPALGTWQHIGTRAEDPLPLTLAQFFPARFTGGGVSYERTAQLGGTNCAAAVFGASLQAAVRRNGCTQVMRASYLAAAQRIMGTIGVLNLADSSGASKAGQVTGSSQFIAQLAAAAGPTHNLAKGTGVEEAEVKGHYLILTWAEFTSLRAPQTARQAAMLKAFSAELIRATVNVSLTSRMVTGKPEVP